MFCCVVGLATAVEVCAAGVWRIALGCGAVGWCAAITCRAAGAWWSICCCREVVACLAGVAGCFFVAIWFVWPSVATACGLLGALGDKNAGLAIERRERAPEIWAGCSGAATAAWRRATGF